MKYAKQTLLLLSACLAVLFSSGRVQAAEMTVELAEGFEVTLSQAAETKTVTVYDLVGYEEGESSSGGTSAVPVYETRAVTLYLVKAGTTITYPSGYEWQSTAYYWSDETELYEYGADGGLGESSGSYTFSDSNVQTADENERYEWVVHMSFFKSGSEDYDTYEYDIYYVIVPSTVTDLEDCTVSLSTSSYTYDGNAKTPEVTVKDGSTTLTSGTDYTVSYSNNTNAGTATVMVTGQGSYQGTVTKTFTIEKGTLTATAKAYSGAYDGESHTITLKGYYSGSKVYYRTSSTGSWKTTKPTRTKVGTTTVYYKITNSNCSNTLTGSKKITVKKGTLSVTAKSYSGTYDRKSHSITLNGTYATSKVYYRTSKTGSWTTKAPTRKKAGTTTVYYKVTDANCSNTVTGTATIKIGKKKVSALTYSEISKKTYTGKKIVPALTVKHGSKKLTEGTDYTLSYSNNKNTGKATITVTGKGNYKGTCKVYFYIVPKKVTIKSVAQYGTSVTVTIKKAATGASGYQYSWRKKGASSWSSSNSKKKAIEIVGAWQSGEVLECRVRPYVTVNGKKQYGSWSAVKKLTIS